MKTMMIRISIFWHCSWSCTKWEGRIRFFIHIWGASYWQRLWCIGRMRRSWHWMNLFLICIFWRRWGRNLSQLTQYFKRLWIAIVNFSDKSWARSCFTSAMEWPWLVVSAGDCPKQWWFLLQISSIIILKESITILFQKLSKKLITLNT